MPAHCLCPLCDVLHQDKEVRTLLVDTYTLSATLPVASLSIETVTVFQEMQGSQVRFGKLELSKNSRAFAQELSVRRRLDREET